MRVLSAILISAASSICCAQATPPDALELLQTASQLSAFNNGSGGPWHLHATYSMTNADGKQTDTGTYEFFWAGPQKSRQSFAGKKFTQTDYMTGQGTLRTGAMEWPMAVDQRVPDSLFTGVPTAASLQNFNVEMHPHSYGGATLRCITLSARGAGQASATIVPTFCLDPESPILRYTSGIGRNVVEGFGATLYNNFFLFRGHSISRDIIVSLWDHPSLKIHVDVLEDLPQGDEAVFTPPANAVRAPPARVYVGQQQMETRITRRSPQVFGFQSNSPNFDGRGVLDIVVGKDGSVRNVKSVMGPTIFEHAQIVAAEKQTYQPVLMNGQPVEVETELSYTMH